MTQISNNFSISAVTIIVQLVTLPVVRWKNYITPAIRHWTNLSDRSRTNVFGLVLYYKILGWNQIIRRARHNSTEKKTIALESIHIELAYLTFPNLRHNDMICIPTYGNFILSLISVNSVYTTRLLNLLSYLKVSLYSLRYIKLSNSSAYLNYMSEAAVLTYVQRAVDILYLINSVTFHLIQTIILPDKSGHSEKGYLHSLSKDGLREIFRYIRGNRFNRFSTKTCYFHYSVLILIMSLMEVKKLVQEPG